MWATSPPAASADSIGGMPSEESTLSYADGRLLRNGAEHRLLGGAIHYFRVHPAQWGDRLDRLKAMGANTLDTYVAWNFHQRRETDRPDFDGWRDLVRFIELAGGRGLDVLVRPGPYICAEWDNAGFPAWLTGRPGVGLRSMESEYRRAVTEWFDVLLPLLTPLQANQGGPIVAFQAENEYGSYGDDPEYVAWTRQVLLEHGVTELIFSADGGNDFYLDGGALDPAANPTMLATGTLGSRGAEAIETWHRRRPGEHFIAAEFWNGWFDHWGEEHHRREAAEASAEVEQILDGGGSVCLYMAHGGTNFGLSSGANFDGGLQPTTTSYDSDAPIAEDGALTGKFHAMRALFGRFSELPELGGLAEPEPVLPAQTLPLTPGLELLSALRKPAGVASKTPLSFEELNCPDGLVLYRAQPILPRGGYQLRVDGLHDRGIVYIDGERVGVFEATAHEPLQLQGSGERAVVEILVENQGRINYGHLLGQGKGIRGLLINQRLSFGWTQIPLPLPDFSAEQLQQFSVATERSVAEPGFFSAHLQLVEPRDTHLALPGFGKGFVWVNGFLLGRYWARGPQRTLYVPAGLLQAGENLFTVLELEHGGDAIEFRERADLG